MEGEENRMVCVGYITVCDFTKGQLAVAVVRGCPSVYLCVRFEHRPLPTKSLDGPSLRHAVTVSVVY